MTGEVVMYRFILNCYIMKKINADKVQSYVPRFITQQEADMIIATPQDIVNILN